MLRGNHPARMDDKGRLKIPNGFIQLLSSHYGSDVFITSITGENVRVYPMEIWTQVERKLEAMPNSHPAKVRFLDRVHFFGQMATWDKQGRVLIPVYLREAAMMSGSVDVLGKYDFLEVWNHERFMARLEEQPYTEEDGKSLAEYGV